MRIPLPASLCAAAAARLRVAPGVPRLAWLLVAAAAPQLALLPVAPTAAAQSADLAKLLGELGFPADTPAQVKAGEIVRADLESSNERELAVGLAFLVKVKPSEFVEELRDGLLVRVDENVEAHGTLSGEGAPSQLADLKLGDLLDPYRKAKPGSALNLSTGEIGALQALEGKPAAAFEEKVREQLLERYRSYRSSGLDGVAPYDRGGEERSGAADLLSATKAASAVQAAAPTFYDTLLHYPKKPATGFQEVYRWERYKAHGAPVLLLVHGFFLQDGDAYSAAQRQFYVSAGYNVEQALAGFLPVSEGTLVVYVNRTSTDQVAGFGGGTKRAMGKKVMASQLEDLFTKLRKAATE